MNRKKHLRQPVGTTDCLLRVIRLSWFDSRHHRRHQFAITRLATSPHSVETSHSCGQTHRPDEILPPAPPADWKPSRTLASDHPGLWTLPRKKNVQTRSLPAVSPKFGSPTAGTYPALPPCRWKVTQNTPQFTRIPVIPDSEIAGKLTYSGTNCRTLITTRRMAGQHAAPDKPQGQDVTAQLVPDYWMLRELRPARGLCMEAQSLVHRVRRHRRLLQKR